MRVFLLSILLTVEALAWSQGFDRRYDAFGWGYAQTALGIESLPDGYMVISGSSDYDSIAPGQFFFHASVLLTKIDLLGEKVWERRSWRPFHGALPGWSNCCDTIPGGGYVVGGASEDTTGFNEVYLMRFDAEGDTLWTKVFGDPNENKFWIGSQVKRTANGDFLIVGITDQNGPFNAFLIRTDSNGNELWRSVYAYASGIEGGLGAIGLAENGDIFTSGTVAFSSTNSDRWVQRHTPDGTVQWQVAWGGIWREGSAHLTVLNDGHLLVSGGLGYAADLTLMRPYLAKLNSADGSIIWNMEYGAIAYGTQFFPAKETPTGDLIAAGVSYANATTDQQGLLCRTTSEGDSLWMYNYFYQDDSMSDGTGRFYDVLPTADGGFIAAGATYFSASGKKPQGISQDTWVVKVDADGCIVPGCNTVGISEQATNLLGALRIWPNPAQGQCAVQLELPASVGSAALLLTVVGADGRVALQSTIAGNGTHTVDLQGLSAGLYHVHVSQGGRWLTGGKLVVE
jgi:hypothetical protein